MPRGVYIRTKKHCKIISETRKRTGNRIPREIRTCKRQKCNNKFDVRINSIKKYCCHNCYGKDRVNKKCKPHSEETKRKIGLANTGKHHSEEAKEKIGILLKGKTNSIETKKRKSKALKKLWQNLKYKEKQLKSMYASMNLKPNKPERRLRNRLNHLFPGEYKYVGNGKVWIGGKCPDFININGQKKIIEMFGDYWHGRKRTKRTKYHEEQLRIKHFAKYGFKTLIIWEKELKNIKEIKKNLRKFQHNLKII